MAVFQNVELPNCMDDNENDGQDQKDKDDSGRSKVLFLTSDYYRYLVEHFNFKVTKVHWISYYKRCWDMPKIFEGLVSLRQEFPKDSSTAALVKSIVNYACGYFGLHRSKAPFMKARIAYKLPKNLNSSKHEAIYLPYFDDKDLYIVKTIYPSAHLKNKSTTPLLHFVGIIEYGKLQMNRAIQIFQRHLRPTAYKILYSNVDNLIIACSSDKFEDALKDNSPEGSRHFRMTGFLLLDQDPDVSRTNGWLDQEESGNLSHRFACFML